MLASNSLSRRDRKRLNMLNHLASVAMGLFERDGFDAVTMEQIAAQADVAKGTLYNHFPTKEAVLACAIHDQLSRDLGPLMQQLAPDAGFVAGVAPLMDAHAQWCETHRDYLAPYLRFRFMDIQVFSPGTSSSDWLHGWRPLSAPQARQRSTGGDPATTGHNDIVDVYAFLISNSQRTGELRKDFKPEHLAVLLHHLCLGALLRWLPTENLKLRQELDAAVELFIQGAAVPSATAARKRGRKL
jgi:TetR/AcrR family transcriptional regulator, regulator of autoinduction and epiphytic fitness